MLDKLKYKVKRHLRKGLPTLALLVAQTTNTTAASSSASIDTGQIVNVVTAVIPLFVLIAVIKLLFRSFKDVT